MRDLDCEKLKFLTLLLQIKSFYSSMIFIHPAEETGVCRQTENNQISLELNLKGKWFAENPKVHELLHCFHNIKSFTIKWLSTQIRSLWSLS